MRQDVMGMIVVGSYMKGRKGWEVVRHTGESTTEDEKLWTLCTLLVTVKVGDVVSNVSTIVGDGCGSPIAGCDN